MSSVSKLYVNGDDMATYCPACGERIEVDESDFNETLPSGNKEYFLVCPNEDCSCGFYASIDYE